MKKRFLITNEHELMKTIELVLKSYGYHVFRTNVGKFKLANGRYFDTGLPVGHPDLYGYTKEGKCFYLEVKYKNGRPSPEQVAFIEEAKSNNCYAGIVYSVEEALAVVRGSGKDDQE